VFRHQGWRDRRRPIAGRADGGHQPPFTGDFHAITTANNLLAALIDNHVYWGNELDIDVRRINWRRVLDMNDRRCATWSRRSVARATASPRGWLRHHVASEVMAIFCLARNLDDLQQRLGNIIFARARGREHRPLRANQLKGQGGDDRAAQGCADAEPRADDEGNPAFVHGGPFANIAHGCNSVMATTTALKLGDYVVTEAGFGADLGAEKFFDIKCRKAGSRRGRA
jgi:formate--tetrahydrofolate ligase